MQTRLIVTLATVALALLAPSQARAEQPLVYTCDAPIIHAPAIVLIKWGWTDAEDVNKADIGRAFYTIANFNRSKALNVATEYYDTFLDCQAVDYFYNEGTHYKGTWNETPAPASPTTTAQEDAEVDRVAGFQVAEADIVYILAMPPNVNNSLGCGIFHRTNRERSPVYDDTIYETGHRHIFRWLQDGSARAGPARDARCACSIHPASHLS
jgi:hypothetical protein